MAFCTNCGAQIPDDAAFCPECGATYETKSGGGKKKPLIVKWKKPLIFAGAALLVVALVFGILALTGVFGSKGLTGTWTYNVPFGASSDNSTIVMVFEKDGTGYAHQIRTDSEYNSLLQTNVSYPIHFYYPLTWDEYAINIDDDILLYALSGNTLTIQDGGETQVFVRTDAEETGKALKAGRYTLTGYFRNGVDRSSEIVENFGSGALSVTKDEKVYLTLSGNTRVFELDGNFFVSDSNDFFYIYDGSTVTVFNRNVQYVFTPAK